MNTVIYPTKEQKEKAQIYNKLQIDTFDLEKCQQNDNKGSTRFYNGGLVECCIVESLGYLWSPFTYGGGFLNHVPDLTCVNLNIGVKSASPHYSVERNVYDCVIKSNIELKSDELFCNYFSEDNKIEIKGICTQEILDKYGDKDLVYGNLKVSGKRKTGFNQYDKLLKVPENLYDMYKTSITSKVVNTFYGIEKNCVYLERVNEDYIAYVVVDSGIILERKLVYFPYFKVMQQELQNQDILNLLDIIARKKVVISMGMTGVLYELKTYNEILGEDKRTFYVACVDIFDLVSQFNYQWTQILHYNSCLDFGSCTRRNLVLLLNAFKVDLNKCVQQKDYIGQNCFYSLICYALLNKELLKGS